MKPFQTAQLLYFHELQCTDALVFLFVSSLSFKPCFGLLFSPLFGLKHAFTLASHSRLYFNVWSSTCHGNPALNLMLAFAFVALHSTSSLKPAARQRRMVSHFLSNRWGLMLAWLCLHAPPILHTLRIPFFITILALISLFINRRGSSNSPVSPFLMSSRPSSRLAEGDPNGASGNDERKSPLSRPDERDGSSQDNKTSPTSQEHDSSHDNQATQITSKADANAEDGSNGGRLQAAAEKRSLTVNTGIPSRSPAPPPISPSASQFQESEKSGRGGFGSSRMGQALATMHEESLAEPTGYHNLSQPPLSAGPGGFGLSDHASNRTARHRSTSSAAALALHGSGSAFGTGGDRFGAPGMRVGGNMLPSRSIWDRDSSPSGRGGLGGAQPYGRLGPHPQLQRGFSLQDVHRDEFDSSGALSSSGTDVSGFSVEGNSGRMGSSAFNTPFASSFDMNLPRGASGFSQTVGFGSQTHEPPSSGTESRRHSIAGGPASDLGAIGGHRRAVGFEVSRDSPLGGATSASRNASEGPPQNRSGMGFRPFGSGSLALTDDDLAGDFDFDPLQKELNRAKQEQDREQQQQQQRRDVDIRVPSANAAATGAHAASMPSFFGERGYDMFGSSPAATGAGGAGGSYHRQLPHAGGMDSLSASWDILTPSIQTGRSPTDSRDSIAMMARQLRETSIGTDYAYRMGSQSSSGVGNDGLTSGTATVKASPGTSPDQQRGSSRFSLSPRAKAFSISQVRAPGSGPGNAVDMSGAMGGTDTMFGDSQNRQRSVSLVDRDGYQVGASGLPARVPGATPLGLDPHRGSTAAESAASSGFPAAFSMPGHSLPAPPQLSELAINGLATLGPMPPSSGGPGGFGGGGQQTDLQELGKGVPLASLPKDTPLYIVEFKQGRTDLFFRSYPPGSRSTATVPAGDRIVKGDLVIVEADRGKDLGTVVNDSITVEQVQSFLAHQSELAILAAGGRPGSDDAQQGGGGSGGMSSSPSSSTAARPARSINPKRLFTKATAADTSLLFSKAQDEERALQLCIAKVTQRGLPMSVVAAEMQWDRRKLTFYYTASMRVDFRDLVKELFRLYKTR